MKKIIWVLTALALCVGLLAACGNKQKQASGTQQQEGSAVTEQGGLEDSVFQENSDTQNGTQPGNQGTSLPTQSSTSTTDQPSEDSTQSTTTSSPVTDTPDSNVVSLDYETFKALTAAQKKAYQESFESIDDFFEWYNAARDAYHNANPPTEIDGSGTVTLP